MLGRGTPWHVENVTHSFANIKRPACPWRLRSLTARAVAIFTGAASASRSPALPRSFHGRLNWSSTGPLADKSRVCCHRQCTNAEVLCSCLLSACLCFVCVLEHIGYHQIRCSDNQATGIRSRPRGSFIELCVFARCSVAGSSVFVLRGTRHSSQV